MQIPVYFYRYQQILKYHMDHNEYLHVIETCKKFGCVILILPHRDREM